MDGAVKEIVAIFSGVIVLAIIATLVSNNAGTANIITQTFKGFGGAISAAEGPVSGNSVANSFNNNNY